MTFKHTSFTRAHAKGLYSPKRCASASECLLETFYIRTPFSEPLLLVKHTPRHLLGTHAFLEPSQKQPRDPSNRLALDVGLAPSAAWRALPLHHPCTLGHISLGCPSRSIAKRAQEGGGKREGEGGEGKTVA